MKKPISIKLDEKLWIFIKDKPNKSRYVEELIKEDIQGQQTKPIVQAVINELLGSEVFFAEIRARIGNSTTNSIPISGPTQNTATTFVPKPPDPITGYPCCQQSKPCKHWHWDEIDQVYRNELTGAVREVGF